MKKIVSGDFALISLFYLCLTCFGAICLLPFLLLLMSSITDEVTLIQNGYNLLPKKFSLDAYRAILETGAIYNAYMVSVFVTIVGTTLSMIVTSALSYALSVKDLKYANKISFFMYFTVLFNGGLVPYYILISKYLHMKNSIWVLIIPCILSPWYVYMLRNFFRTVPESLAESAKIDGANEIYILIKIIIPVSLPAMASIGLFYALGFWNEWFRALLFIEKKEFYPLQYIIMSIIRNLDFANSMMSNSDNITKTVPAFSARMATTVVTIGPIILLYPFLQKYFVKGLTMGAVKG